MFEQISYTVSESARNVRVCIIANGLTQNTTAIVFTQNTQPTSATGKYFTQAVIIVLKYTPFTPLYSLSYCNLAPDDYGIFQVIVLEFGPSLASRQCVTIAIADDIVCEDREGFLVAFVYERSTASGPTTTLLTASVFIDDDGKIKSSN